MSKKRFVKAALMLMAPFVFALLMMVYLRTAKTRVDLTISSLQREFKLGDEMTVHLEVENIPDKPFPWDKPRWYERLSFFSGRYQQRTSSLRFALLVKGPDGSACVAPLFRAVRFSGSGRATDTGIVSTLNVNDYALVGKPGTYTIEGTFKVVSFPGDSTGIFLRSRPIDVVVKSRTSEEMGRHIAGLTNDLQAAKNYSESSLAFWRMMYTRDNRIVPAVLQFEYEAEGRNIPRAALLTYLPIEAETKVMILAEVMKRGLTETTLAALRRFGCSDEEFKEVVRISIASNDPRCLKAAMQAAALYPDASYDSRFIDLANAPSSSIRREAIAAIAANPTEKGLGALENLTADPDKSIAGLAKAALKWAEQQSRPPSLLPQQTDLVTQLARLSSKETKVIEVDEDKIAIAADARNPDRWDAVRYLVAVLSNEDYATVGKLADEPQKEATIEEANEAVTVIADLLRDTDKDVRDVTTTLIRLDDRMNIAMLRMLFRMERRDITFTVVD